LITRAIYNIFILILMGITSSVSAQGLRLETPYIAGFHPLDEEANEFSMLRTKHPVLMTLQSKMFIDTSSIDFEKRQLSFRRIDPLGYTLWEYFYPELSDYLSERRNFSLRRDWRLSTSKSLGGEDKKSKHDVSKLQWELPVQYPSWAQRILGNEPPRLTVDGSLKLTIGGSGQSNKKSENSPETSSGEFILDEDYQFSISGSVGRLINVNIRTSKESGFEFSDNLKNFKVEYKESYTGELEDEIVQEVVAGYTDFNMTGQSLAGIVEAKKGLFGIKLKTKFGPLMLTSIAATEQAESNSKTFSKNTASSSSATEISQYEKNRFFYLDNSYRAAYIRRYGKGGNSDVSTASPVDSLEVWVKSTKYHSKILNFEKDTIYPLDIPDPRTIGTDEILKIQPYIFVKLKENIQYKLDKDDGYISFYDSTSLGLNDQIVIYMEAKGHNKGEYRIIGNDTIRAYWTLKPEDVVEPTDTARFNLMWKNVYNLPSDDLSNYHVSVKKRNLDEGSTTTDKDDADKLYSEIVGLTDKDGDALTSYSHIFRAEDGVLVLPPWDTAGNADFPFINPALKGTIDTVIYKYSKTSMPTNYSSKFFIEGAGSDRSSGSDYVYEIGDYGIIEGTDKVWADGSVLERDKDYVINYDMGTIEMLSLRAKAANSVKLDYQSQSAFVPDRKVFLGMNGQVQLPFISDKSYIGGTLLYQNVKVAEDIPRLGQEPYSKKLYDFNMNIELEPEWMTAIVNKIPLIESSAESKVKFSAEVAHSKMDPNPDGKAYIDDFEDCKVSDNIGSSGEEWYQASPPDSMLTDFYHHPPAWDFYWFSPGEWDAVNRIPKTDLYIYENDVSVSVKDGYVSAVRFHCTPSTNELKNRYKKTWAGVMTPVPRSFSDKSKMQYLDLYIRDSTVGKTGKLKIQLGQMREDISLDGKLPNGAANMEDTTILSDNYSEERDRGLDTLFDTSEYYYIPGEVENTWQRLNYGNDTLGIFRKDPSKDNAKIYNEDNRTTFHDKCRNQKNEYLETEDINNNGTVETATKESYFQFTIDLKDTSAYYYDRNAKIQKSRGWRKIHLPLQAVVAGSDTVLSTSGTPSWTSITMVRMIWTDFDTTNLINLTKESKLTIAEMGFVGSQWESSVSYIKDTADSTGKTVIADTTGAKIEALSIGNKDDSLYTSPFTVDKDGATNEEEREQSLKLSFSKLKPGREAVVSKNTSYQDLNLTSYKRLKMDVYGKSESFADKSLPLYDGHVKFIFRFGTDSTTYYEYRREIYPGWTSNKIDIDLQKLAKAKNLYMTHHPDTTIDSVGEFIIKAPKGRQPNLANIDWMALGVYRENIASGEDELSGEIWINEMILSDIEEISGWAAKGELELKFADLFNINADMEYTNGNYRKMNDYNKTPNNSSVTGSVDVSLSVDKFLPSDYGVSLPVGANVSSTVNRPQIKNNDVLLSDDGSADNLLDMSGDLFRMMKGEVNKDFGNESEVYGRQTATRKIFTSYGKSSPSETWVADLLADRITSSFTYTNNLDDSSQGYDTTGRNVYKIFTETNSYNGSLKYDLSPREEVKYKPIQDDTSYKWLPEQLRDYEFSLLPSKFNFTLADAGFSTSHSEDDKKKTQYNKKSFGMKHDFQMDYSPINPLLKFNYSLSIDRDLDTLAYRGTEGMLDGVFKRNPEWKNMYILYGERTRSQTAGVTLDPQLFGWWTNTIDYSSSYNSSLAKRDNDTNDYFNSKLGLSFNFNSRIDFEDFVSMFTKPHKAMKTKRDSSVIAFENGLKKIGFRQVGFTYSAKTDLRNNYLGKSLLDVKHYGFIDYFTYQLGLKGRNFRDVVTGDMDDTKFGGMRSRNGIDKKELYANDERSVDQGFTISSGFDLKVPFDISFNPISIRWAKKFSVDTNTAQFDTTIDFPDISIPARTPALMKLGFFKDYFKNFDLSSNFGYRKSTHISSSDPDTTIRFDLNPLISANWTIKRWPIIMSYSHKYTNEKNHQALSRDSTKTNGDELTLSYQIEKSGRLNEIKILYWTIPIKGKTTIGVTASRESSEKKITSGDSTVTSKYLLNPYLTYIFTDHVTGTLRWNATYDKKNTEIDKENEILIEIEIKFR